jgi:hypothetical protein
MDKYTKFILTMIAVGLFLNIFSTPITTELLGTKKAMAEFIEGRVAVKILNWPECK